MDGNLRELRDQSYEESSHTVRSKSRHPTELAEISYWWHYCGSPGLTITDLMVPPSLIEISDLLSLGHMSKLSGHYLVSWDSL